MLQVLTILCYQNTVYSFFKTVRAWRPGASTTVASQIFLRLATFLAQSWVITARQTTQAVVCSLRKEEVKQNGEEEKESSEEGSEEEDEEESNEEESNKEENKEESNKEERLRNSEMAATEATSRSRHFVFRVDRIFRRT
jgi:hypothetical protein